MENQSELLRMISQSLQHNQAINNEILKLIGQTTLPPHALQELQRLLSMNAATLKLIQEHTPI